MLQPPAHDAGLARAALLLIPWAVWIACFVSRKYTVRDYAGAFLAFVWHFQAALIVSILLIGNAFGVLRANEPLFYGIPVDILLGQAVLLGPVSFLMLKDIGPGMMILITSLGGCFLYGLITVIPWWNYDLLMAAAAIAPSLLLAQFTAKDSHIYLRSALQSLAWICLLFWLFPSAVFEHTGHSWQPFLSRPHWQNLLYLLPLSLPALMLLSALRQFAVEGGGTAFPFDPPQKLVTKGIYAYLSNPMQVGICLAMAWWGVVTACAWITLSSAIAVALFIVFKDICNGSCAIGEEAPDWHIYQREVPKWIPRTTPWRRD